jgi:CRP-like cAMP-binding protein
MAKNGSVYNCVDCNCKAAIFKNLSENELGVISKSRYQCHFKAGEIMFKQGTPSPYFLCLTSGLAKLYLEGLGKNLIIALVKPVEYIFGPGIYTDNIHHYSAAAVEDSSACLVDAQSYKQLIRSNPDFAEEFIQRISFQAIKNFELFVSLTQKQMHGRIADALFYLSNEIYSKNPFLMSLSRQDLADLSGMSKESAIRILKDFKDEGIINIDGKQFEILKPDLLRQISETG